MAKTTTLNTLTKEARYMAVYTCGRCGGAVVAESTYEDGMAISIFPSPESPDAAIPERARAYMRQALASIHAPAGAVMLSASAVDAMLQAKGLRAGSLYARIDQAAAVHLITADMAEWAHEVRLDANEQRHSDIEAPMATPEDASRLLSFTAALAQFLFVLPARVASGRRGRS
jgi:hypothetical protein